MSILRLPGLLTGIDTSQLIEQMMAIERRQLNLFEERKSVWEERQDALSTLETKLKNLRTAARNLSDAESLRAFSVSSSDTDKLTADATNDAFEGNHTVVVNQLATSERWVCMRLCFLNWSLTNARSRWKTDWEMKERGLR